MLSFQLINLLLSDIVSVTIILILRVLASNLFSMNSQKSSSTDDEIVEEAEIFVQENSRLSISDEEDVEEGGCPISPPVTEALENCPNTDSNNGDSLLLQGSAPDGNVETPVPVRYYTKRTLKYQMPSSSMEPLPEGWIMIQHRCGLPAYFHKKTRVVTWSRPYVVTGEMGGVKKHDLPIASIPCLDYQIMRKKIEEELSNMSNNSTDEANLPNGIKTTDENQVQITNDEVSKVTDNSNNETDLPESCKKEMEENRNPSKSADLPKAIIHGTKDLYIEEADLCQYLNKRFLFDVTSVPQFDRWADKRLFTKSQKREAAIERFSKEDTPKKLGPAKVITLTIPREPGSNRTQKVVFNTGIKPMVCILHEYAQSVLKTKPHYIFETKDDSSEPFEATIVINDKNYGSATGINKKTAKNKAALNTMEILVPGFKNQVQSLSGETSMDYFNDVTVTDPRVYELCLHAGNYYPFQLLSECLKRNQGIADTTSDFTVQVGKGKMIEYKMECGRHTVTGSAKNKKIGKQHASQKILQCLHPKVKSWGELILMYGTSVATKRARKKNIEQEIFELKQRKPINNDSSKSTNVAVTSKEETSSTAQRSEKNALVANPELLEKLREMMLELRKSEKSKKRKAEENQTQGGEGTGDRKRSKLLLIDV